MANRSGIGAQLGISTVESSYGTYTAPTTFPEFTSENLRLVKDYIRTNGIRAGRAFQSENLHVATTRHVEGSVSFDAQDKGLGKWLDMLHPNTVTPTAVTGGLLRQTHNIGGTGVSDPFAKSRTIQVGRPDVSGTSRVFSYLGCRCTGVTFSLERGGVVTTEWNIDGRDEDVAQSLASATYATASVPFNFLGASLEFDDVVLTDRVRSATIQITLPLDTERYCIGSTALKGEPILNGPISVEITLEAEFTSMTQHTAFTAATRRKVELNCLGTTTSGTYTSALNFTAPATVLTSAGPVVEGPDVLTQSLVLEVVDDNTNTPFSIDYISSDASI